MSLSERIAALNNKAKPSSHHPQSSPQGSPSSLPRSGVKEKAARFDGLGVAPAPRGSFGLGAPMLAAGQKSNKELWGNRIPSVGGGRKPASSLGSRSPVHSRTSSMDVGASGTPDPLTEEAVGSLGAAVLVDPLASRAEHAFRSVAPSVLDDASSSVAVEAAEEDRSMLDVSHDDDDDGRASPALSDSTMSDSALKEAPPILSPVSSSAQIHMRATSNSIYDPMSVAATEGSSSIPAFNMSMAIDSETPPTSEVAALHLDDDSGFNPPVPLSSHLLQSLQASMPSRLSPSASGMDTPKSVMVETGSMDGKSKLDDIDISEEDSGMMIDEDKDESSHGDFDLKSDKGGDDNVDLDIQPGLRMAAPILPLSSAHLKSLNVQSSLNRAIASGLETPRSMMVEDGSDGSGRRSPMTNGVGSGVESDYTPQSDLTTPPGVVLELPVEDSGARSPVPLSPAVLAYAVGDTTMAEHTPSAPPTSTLQIPGSATEHVDMSTPVAMTFALPEVERTPMSDKSDPMQSSLAMTPAATVRAAPKKGEAYPMPDFTVNDSSVDNEITTLSMSAASSDVTPSPSPRPTRTRSLYGGSDAARPRLETAAYFLHKPLPPPPQPGEQQPGTPGSSLPATPIIIEAFPPVPSYRPVASGSGKYGVGLGISTGPTTTLSPMSAHSRPHSTHAGMSGTSGGSAMLRRSVSTTDLHPSSAANGQLKKRRKKPQLVPGVWIGDDDVRDSDDEEETGWASIVVTRHVIS